MNIQNNLFDLTKDQEYKSKMIYGKIIKCLVAPYHSYSELEKHIPFTKTTYLFPEREMSYKQTISFINMLVKKHSVNDEFRIITTSYSIIGDMVGECVRVLNADGEVFDPNVKTFQANIHDIRYDLLENKYHNNKNTDNISTNIINELISRINDKNVLADGERDILYNKIQMIGEDVIRTEMLEMLRDKK
jgi:hypothetical protein